MAFVRVGLVITTIILVKVKIKIIAFVSFDNFFVVQLVCTSYKRDKCIRRKKKG